VGQRDGVSLVVSLDGPPLLHDRHRVYLNGRPISRVVLKNIRLLMERSTQPIKRLRAVACEQGSMVPLHRYFLDLGFNEIHVQPLLR
jgi:sulfatase maturation enzyme AslB (radical SAM superfamily)